MSIIIIDEIEIYILNKSDSEQSANFAAEISTNLILINFKYIT